MGEEILSTNSKDNAKILLKRGLFKKNHQAFCDGYVEMFRLIYGALPASCADRLNEHLGNRKINNSFNDGDPKYIEKFGRQKALRDLHQLGYIKEFYGPQDCQ